ncbi:MAG: DNA polymerase I [Planctomycetes bacterium]|nr:DNA polymerase I [Planctomycetota bacterium]
MQHLASELPNNLPCILIGPRPVGVEHCNDLKYDALMPESLYLLDGHAQIYRAYYAPFRDLTSPSGEPTRATYVFFSMFFNLLKDRKPTYFAMAVDSIDSAKSRREIYPQYKATREPPPDDLPPQIERIVASLKAIGMPVLSVANYEADDILATLARRFEKQSIETFLVSKDKDFEQLISERVKLYDPAKDAVIDAAALEASKGYLPDKAIEIQSLMGDNVDDIPGIVGVGIKTAAKLIAKYGTAEAVIEHADELTPKMSEKVKAYAPHLATTRKLVTLRADLPVEFDLEQARVSALNFAELEPVFRELGFTRLLEQLDLIVDRGGTTRETPPERSVAPVPAAIDTEYILVDTPEKLAALVGQLRQQKIFAFDTETTSLNPVAAKLVGISISWEAGRAFYVPVRGVGGDSLPQEDVVRALRPMFEDAAVAKCGQNIKYDLIVLAEAGIAVVGELFDSMVASFLLDPLRRSHSMDWLARELYDHTMIPISDLIGKGKKQITIDNVDITRVCEYAAEDADFTWRFYETLRPQLDESSFLPLFAETEMRLVQVLAQMERNGVALDVPLLVEMGKDLERQRVKVTAQIYAEAGRNFNIDSTKQLAEVLFDEQGLRVVRKTKTGRSTDADSLGTLAAETNHPLPELVLHYRELTKLKSTYVDTLPRMVCAKTGRVHASYNMIGAVTGRLASNDPNLQNIPIRTALGRQIRKAFVAGKPDHVLLTADYSQVELRLLAHYCQDAALVSAFERNEDIHRFVAAQVFGVDAAEVTADQRSRAKAVNFGIIYGQSAFGLSRTTGMSVPEAQNFIDMYFMRYPGIRLFIDECVEKAKQTGYATTILGRRRPVPELQSRNRQQRMLGERLAVNTVLQGSAADLIKKAMIDVHDRIKENPAGPRMLIQVHDELVFEVHEDSAACEAEKIREQMCSALPLKVPLAVDTCWGRNWLEGKSH